MSLIWWAADSSKMKIKYISWLQLKFWSSLKESSIFLCQTNSPTFLIQQCFWRIEGKKKCFWDFLTFNRRPSIAVLELKGYPLTSLLKVKLAIAIVKIENFKTRNQISRYPSYFRFSNYLSKFLDTGPAENIGTLNICLKHFSENLTESHSLF